MSRDSGLKEVGVFGKYIIAKADGSPIDPEACYFVLRLDTDEAARFAALEYARRCDNRALAHDITKAVVGLNSPPRDSPFSDVWRAGESHV